MGWSGEGVSTIRKKSKGGRGWGGKESLPHPLLVIFHTQFHFPHRLLEKKTPATQAMISSNKKDIKSINYQLDPKKKSHKIVIQVKWSLPFLAPVVRFAKQYWHLITHHILLATYYLKNLLFHHQRNFLPFLLFCIITFASHVTGLTFY